MDIDPARDQLIAYVTDAASARQRFVDISEAVTKTGQPGEVWTHYDTDSSGRERWRIFLRLPDDVTS